VVDESDRKTKVLVIDDEEHLRTLLADILESDGYQVKTAAHGREGLDSFQAERHDVVITDLGMPEMSGLEVAAAIKKIDPSTPVVLLTGLGFQFEGKNNENMKFDLLMSKPFQLDEVLAVVQNALRMKENNGVRV
jgi:DNA-binding response OmpR family regulator